MKKLLVIAFSGMLFLTACQNSSTPSADQIKKMALSQEKRIGLMQSLGGAYLSSQATHLLKMEDGKTLYLKSTNVDLKDSKYSNKEVEVMGEIVRTTDGNQVMDVKSIDILDVETSAANELPQWLDYSSTNIGLTLKYRDDYEVTEEGNIISIIQKPEEKTENSENLEKATGTEKVSDELAIAKIELSLLSSATDFDLAKVMDVTSLSSADVLAGGYNRSKITQKAVEAYKKSVDGGKEIDYFLKNSEGSYKISFLAGKNEDGLIEDQNMFYDILSSVDFSGSPSSNEQVEMEKVINNSESKLETESPVEDKIESVVEEDSSIDQANTSETLSGFETFKSDSQNFTIQYPKSYYFGSVAPQSSDAIKSYQFGSKPLEEQDGEINLSVISGNIPEGKESDYNGVKMTIVSIDGVANVYLEENGKKYLLSAPSSKLGLLQQMASTIQ